MGRKRRCVFVVFSKVFLSPAVKIRKYTELDFLPISWINNNGIDIVYLPYIHIWIYKKPSKKK